MSAVAQPLGYDPGVSQEAETLRTDPGSLDDSLAATHAGVYWDLFEAAQEAAFRGWNGHNGEAVSEATLRGACSLVALLRSAWPRPEILVDSEGDIWFHWQQGTNRNFSVAVGQSGVVHFAGLFGPHRIRGAEGLNENLLDVLSRGLKRVYQPSA